MPGLITSAQALEESAEVSDTARCWAVSARIHDLAASTLAKVGEGELAWMSAERAISAAESQATRSPSPQRPAPVHARSARGRPVRRCGEPRPHPPIDLFAAAPLSANSVAKLALGIADNQALTVLCENIAHVPMIVFPRINGAHARQPAWSDHLDRLRSVGVELIYGDDVWPLAGPRAAGSRELPWSAILDAVLVHC